MKYEIIGSSSKGNSIVVEDILLLDCGVTYKKIKPYLNKIKLIFISHIHKDHLKPSTIKQIAYNYPTIRFVTGSVKVAEELLNNGVNVKNINILKDGKKYDLGLLKIKLEHLYHDVPNYGLKWEIKGKKGIYLVDTARVDHIEAKNYDLYLIESNYNEQLLEQHIQKALENGDEENKLYYLYRVSKVHLSDTQCNDFLIENMSKNSVYEKIHKSSYNYVDID